MKSDPDQQGRESLPCDLHQMQKKERVRMDTSKAKYGYKVCRFKRPLYGFLLGNFTEDECVHLRAVMDGDRLIMIACLVPMDEYLQEREQNEMFHLCERFTTVKGYRYIYWRDEETDTDYITKED